MGTCWYCWWGWAKPVADIYRRASGELGSEDILTRGPGHIVWSDENWNDFAIEFCLGQCDDIYFKNTGWKDRDLEIVRKSLEDLLAIPSHIRDCEPEDYDGEHPENFPPPVGIEMITRNNI